MSQFIRVAKSTDIPEGQLAKVEVGSTVIVLANVGGSFYALEDLCTHDGGPLGEGELDGCQLICPRHGARFDARSGEALTMPAFEAVPVYEVRVDGEDILIAP